MGSVVVYSIALLLIAENCILLLSNSYAGPLAMRLVNDGLVGNDNKTVSSCWSARAPCAPANCLPLPCCRYV